MSETKFTPGPWRWHGDYLLQDCPAFEGNGKETNPYSTPCGHPIASDGSAGGEYNPSIDIDGPDAHLIAAAPDLYEALERLLEFNGTNYREGTEGFESCIESARAALAKARGETPEGERLKPA